MTPEIIKEKIMQNIPDADVVVEDLAGDQKHFGVDVISSKFKGKSIIEQHQMIYKALGDALKEKIHALRIKTTSKIQIMQHHAEILLYSRQTQALK